MSKVTVKAAKAGKAKAKAKGKEKGKETPAGAKNVETPAGAKNVKNKAGVPVETRLSQSEDGRFASVKIFGHPLSQVLRLLGRKGMRAAQVRVIMDELGLKAVRLNTIADKVNEGRAGDESVQYAPLGNKEVAKLTALAPKE